MNRILNRLTRSSKKSSNGFTIIEVLIVLAIAGLILTIVFIAVPQLQRNARDNQRQNIASRLSTELQTFSSNNQGQYPFSGVTGSWALCSSETGSQSCNDWLSRYITGNVKITDPQTGGSFTVNISTSTALPAWAAGNVYISAGNKCSGESIAAGTGAAGASSKQYALLITLERDGTYFCVDNG